MKDKNLENNIENNIENNAESALAKAVRGYRVYERRGDIFKAIRSLCSLCSVSGSEMLTDGSIKKIYGEFFDSITVDSVGNYLLYKSSGKENAVKIMIDAHYDEIGFVVTEVLDGGFLRITNIGGVDRAIMQAADVTVYGKETLSGVIISTPPHLRSGGNKLPQIEELFVDLGIGYTKDELSAIAPVGTVVTFKKVYKVLENDKFIGASLDNKACAAIAIDAIINTPKEELAGDVYITLSCREETGRSHGGAYVIANRIKPDYALVIDVNLANAPDVPSRESVKMDEGISISYSPVTSRALTLLSARLCEEAKIDYQKKTEAHSTGTNAPAVNLAAHYVPVVDVGLPIRNMHTYSELASMIDCCNLWSFVRLFASSCEIANEFRREELEI